MANQNDFIVKNGIVVQSTATIPLTSNLVTTSVARTIAKPSLDLNFTRSTSLDSRLTFSRSGNATFVGANGYISYSPANQPRFDYDQNTGQLRGLLIEEQRTNLFTNSSAFSLWGKSSGLDTVIDNAAISPDGYQTASYVNANGITNSYLNGTFAVASSGTTYTKSIFGKAGTTSNLIFECPDYITGPAFFQTTFNLSTGQITANAAGNTSTIITYPNGWYRCSVTRTYSTASSGGTFYVGAYGTGLGSIYLWGAQFEAGTMASTYIPTGSASATRTADKCSLPAGSWYSQNQGTLYAESYMAGPRTSGASFTTALYSSSNDYIGIQYVYSVGGYGGTTYLLKNGIQSVSASPGGNFNQIHKSAVAFDSSSAVSANDGTLLTHSGTYSGPPLVSQLTIGGRSTSGSDFQLNGSIRRITYWPQKVSNAQLQLLTTL